MTSAPARTSRREEGSALIEVLVSALVIAIVGGGVMTLLQSTARSSGDQRRHSAAFAIAQEDQARLRTMRISSLNKLQQTRTVNLDGDQFTVLSTGVFVNNTTGTASCTSGASSADYVRITSTVSWPEMGNRPPAVIQSVVAPSNGSVDPGHGTLTINATNAAGTPLSGVSISGTGPGTFSGSTDTSGCANFADLPSGNYTMTTSAGGMVNENGETTTAKTVGVIASGTQTISLRYDLAGSVPVEFKYRVGSSNEFAMTKADSVFAYHPELPAAGKVFGTPGGTRQTSISGTSLFPFTTPYTVYSGSCASNNPNPKGESNPPGAAAMAGVTIPAGKTVEPPIVLQLPALSLTVKTGTTAVSGAKVTVTDVACEYSGSNVKRTYFTDSSGIMPEPGLPWGVYDICASANISGTNRRFREFAVPIQTLTSATTRSFNLSGSGSESNKTC